SGGYGARAGGNVARKPGDVEDPRGGGSSLGDLLRAKGLSGTTTSEAAPPPAPTTVTGSERLGGKIVVRRSRKGRGGKTVTLVQGVDGGVEELARRLRKALGCGTSVDDGEIVVQGDQVARVAG